MNIKCPECGVTYSLLGDCHIPNVPCNAVVYCECGARLRVNIVKTRIRSLLFFKKDGGLKVNVRQI